MDGRMTALFADEGLPRHKSCSAATAGVVCHGPVGGGGVCVGIGAAGNWYGRVVLKLRIGTIQIQSVFWVLGVLGVWCVCYVCCVCVSVLTHPLTHPPTHPPTDFDLRCEAAKEPRTSRSCRV